MEWSDGSCHGSRVYFSRPAQITRSQYQNGLMASRLDSSPQSPESTRLETDTSPQTEAPEVGADETTSLLNDQNRLPAI